jgi:hypothetical protein
VLAAEAGAVTAMLVKHLFTNDQLAPKFLRRKKSLPLLCQFYAVDRNFGEKTLVQLANRESPS